MLSMCAPPRPPLFLDEKVLEMITERFETSSWRVFNHESPVTGVAPKSLEIIFNAWLFPIYEYGSPVWIFRLKNCFHYSCHASSQYSSIFGRLERLYHRIAKSMFCVDRSTTNVATLVRLGWMPLDYRIAFGACIRHTRIVLGLAGDSIIPTRAVRKVIGLCERRSEFSRFCFYKPAHDFIRRFDPELLRSEPVSDFQCCLRGKILSELFGSGIVVIMRHYVTSYTLIGNTMQVTSIVTNHLSILRFLNFCLTKQIKYHSFTTCICPFILTF